MNDVAISSTKSKVSPAVVALKFVVITVLLSCWGLALSLSKKFGIASGAIPTLIISVPFIYGWWRVFKSPGGNIAMLLLVLLVLAGVLFITLF